jgi:GT2 family glycosyltransferase
MKKKNPKISIIVVNWNGKQWLKNCIESLEKQTYKDFEIIFIDNNSSDGSVVYVEKRFPKIVIVQTGANLGFAGGNNVGFAHAKGEYILLLNNDTVSLPDFLENFVKAFDTIPKAGCVQSKIVSLENPKNLDMVGAYWTDSSFLYYYGYGKLADLPQYNKAMPFFTCKGASVMIPRTIIEKIGLFDDDFWLYYEETDFCHRVWLAGYECWYYPQALMYHAGGGTAIKFDNSIIQFHNFKNKLLSFLKNFEIKSLLTIIPTFIILNVVLSLLWLFQGKQMHFIALYKAIWWNIVHFKKTLAKRKKIQTLRKKSDKEIFSLVKKNPRFNYYLNLFRGNVETYADN